MEESKIAKETKWLDNFKCYWFCPQCRGFLYPKAGLRSGGKFSVNKKNSQIAITAAIKQKKILPDAADRVHIIAQAYFEESKLNQVQLRGVQCRNPDCKLETVTITLAFRYDDFIKNSGHLPRHEQLKLYQTGCEKVNYCEACGHEYPKGSIFCTNCGHKYILEESRNSSV